MIKNKDWWKVENLSKQEEEISQTNDLNKLDNKNDFASYKEALITNDLVSSNLGSHNELDPEYRIKYINSLLDIDKKSIKNILDVGCGAGFISNFLSIFYSNAKVSAIDISSDAIKYGKKHFNNIEFICKAIDPKDKKIGDFDLIFCFEFYPFTRTDDYQTHVDYLYYLLRQLNDGGSLIIYQIWENYKSLSSNYKNIQIQDNFKEYIFNDFRVPHKIIIKLLRYKPLCLLVDLFARLLFQKKHNRAIIISKK